MSGIRSRIVYDPNMDPKLMRYEKLDNAIKNLMNFAGGERSRKEAREDKLYALNVSAAQQEGLTVDAEQYFNDKEYRDNVDYNVKIKRNIARKAKTWGPTEQGSIAPFLSSYTSIIGDASPFDVDWTDLTNLKRVVVEGRPELNELPITALTEEEISGIPGIADELSRLGLWGIDSDGNDEEWDTVRKNLPDRMDWFIESFQDENKHYVADESEAMDAHVKRMLTAESRKTYAEQFEAVKDYRKAESDWDTRKARLFPTDGEGKFLEELKSYEAQAYSMTVEDLANLKEYDKTSYDQLLIGLEEENPAVLSVMQHTLGTYTKGKELLLQFEDRDPLIMMEAQKASKLRLESMEEAQGFVFPLAQEYAYLTLVSEGLEKSDMNPSVAAKRMQEIQMKMAEYKNYQSDRFIKGEFYLRPDMLGDMWNKQANKNIKLILKPEGEKESYDKKREEWDETIKDLDYNNVLESLDLLGTY